MNDHLYSERMDVSRTKGCRLPLLWLTVVFVLHGCSTSWISENAWMDGDQAATQGPPIPRAKPTSRDSSEALPKNGLIVGQGDGQGIGGTGIESPGEDAKNPLRRPPANEPVSIRATDGDGAASNTGGNPGGGTPGGGNTGGGNPGGGNPGDGNPGDGNPGGGDDDDDDDDD